MQPAPSQNTALAAQPLSLVFVCIQNANRSQMAQAWARMLGGDRVEAFSAGSYPSGVINPKAVAAMAELGYDLSSHTSKSFGELPQVKFDALVGMGSTDVCPGLSAVCREEWAIPDPKHLPEAQFRAVRNLIGWRVYDLLLDMGVKPVRSVLPFVKP